MAGGSGNTASGKYATVSGGAGAVASHYGESAYASGWFGTTPGNAQTSEYVLRNTSTGTDLTTLYLDGGWLSQVITVPVGHDIAFEIMVAGRNETGDKAAAYIIRGMAYTVGATGFAATGEYAYQWEIDDMWNVQLNRDVASRALLIQARGNTGDTVRWVAYVRTVEVGW